MTSSLCAPLILTYVQGNPNRNTRDQAELFPGQSVGVVVALLGPVGVGPGGGGLRGVFERGVWAGGRAERGSPSFYTVRAPPLPLRDAPSPGAPAAAAAAAQKRGRCPPTYPRRARPVPSGGKAGTVVCAAGGGGGAWGGNRAGVAAMRAGWRAGQARRERRAKLQAMRTPCTLVVGSWSRAVGPLAFLPWRAHNRSGRGGWG